MVDTSLIIIGAGPGGYETAIAAAKKGVQTVLIEAHALGGTCLNEGCIPTKCLCRNAELLDDINQANQFGISLENVHFDFSEAIRRKDEVVETLRGGIQTLLKSSNLTIVEGQARFVASHTVAVGEGTYTAPHIIIATGSVSKSLLVPGADGESVISARELLSREVLPQRLCIVGGGVIGLEFASIFRSFGSDVTVVEYAKEVLPAFDRDLAKRLRMSLKRKGIVFHIGAAVSSIAKNEMGSVVTFDTAGKTGSVEADLVLMAVGRVPRVDGLDLETAGIAYTGKGIQVDGDMQTSLPGVYAIGDVNGLCPLAHAATAQGRVALSHILGLSEKTNLKLVPAAVFTVPEVATVGLTEEQISAQKIEYKAFKAFYRANGKSLAMGTTDGMVKILTDSNEIVIGAHIMGAHASDLIHELTMAMEFGATLSKIRTMIHAHPSLSEIVHDAAMA